MKAAAVFLVSVGVVAGWISQEDATAAVLGVGALSAAFVAFVTAARLPLISRPGRWLWRRLVAEPVKTFLHESLDAWADLRIRPELEPIRERLASLEQQHRRNGGSTTRDRIEKIAERVGADPPPDDPG